jgi:NAD(P)-dependent dehydrogenase (short-subunit alcohol dehydrogenase family)
MSGSADSLFDLTGKRAVVTGGGSGIGLAMARALARYGADVCLWGRAPRRLRDAVATLDGPGRFSTRSVDVSDETAVDDAMSSLVKDWGGLDVAVVNAGTNHAVAPFLDFATDDYRSTLAVNLDGAWFTMRAAARAMVAPADASDRGGSIIAVASLAETFNQKVISRVPQRRWGRPEDFEGVAVYLASEASRFQTASSIVIDGGYSMF